LKLTQLCLDAFGRWIGFYEDDPCARGGEWISNREVKSADLRCLSVADGESTRGLYCRWVSIDIAMLDVCDLLMIEIDSMRGYISRLIIGD
jgi:hypothetical protein